MGLNSMKSTSHRLSVARCKTEGIGNKQTGVMGYGSQHYVLEQCEPSMDEIIRFVMLAQSARFTVSELCDEYVGISRKTGYKYLDALYGGSLEGIGCAQSSFAPVSATDRYGSGSIDIGRTSAASNWRPLKLHKVLEVKHGIEFAAGPQRYRRDSPAEGVERAAPTGANRSDE